LATDAEQAVLAKKLATIILDVPITVDIKKCNVSKIDWQAARDAFESYEFKSLLARLPSREDYI
jgi:DNA polymerase-1